MTLKGKICVVENLNMVWYSARLYWNGVWERERERDRIREGDHGGFSRQPSISSRDVPREVGEVGEVGEDGESGEE